MHMHYIHTFSDFFFVYCIFPLVIIHYAIGHYEVNEHFFEMTNTNTTVFLILYRRQVVEGVTKCTLE